MNNLALPHSVLHLPVMELASDITQALSTGDVLLRAAPGAGKSTGLPLALLLNANLKGTIILLEPRRLAARSVAARLASHLNEKVGQRVGLRMRAETRISAETQLTVVTEGVLTRLLQDDPSLEGVALIIFDEFHERSLHADLGLALCLEVQQAIRNDLRLLLMSATLDTDQLYGQLHKVRQFDCVVRQHQVESRWIGEQSDPLEQRIVRAVLTAITEHDGDVLVFLPGVAEINRTATLLKPRLEDTVQLHKLHSGINQEAQRKATSAAQHSHRRVILSTSLAETSITIDGVRVVIDSGLERRSKIDSSSGAHRLETVTASQASATQRAGRAGRTASGVCYRLWNETGHTRRPKQWQPEILRADLTPLLLELHIWGASSHSDLHWLDHPPKASINRAAVLLTRLGLVKDGQLTTNGRAVAALPVHPRLGWMLIWAAKHNATLQACRLAALLEEQQNRSDSADLYPAIQQPLNTALSKRVSQLTQRLKNANNQTESPSAAILLAQAFPDWIAQRRAGEPVRFRLACGAGAVMHNADTLAHCEWLIVAQLGGTGNQLRIFKALEINIDELKKYSPEFFSKVNHLDWDEKQQRVIAESRVMLENLIVESRPQHDISNSDKAKALLVGIRKLGLSCLPWDDACIEWRARVERMRGLSTIGHNINWPEVDDDALLNNLEAWLLPYLDGIGTIKALQQLDLNKILKALIDYPQQALLDEWLPQRYTVPSGSQIKLQYSKPGDPLLSVRLQEMLGCSENPSIANGQIILKVELLSPAQRPVQVTTDLVNFWSNSYPAVKKEMAGRYPKHPWPDDPLAAQATTRTKRYKK
jgi:ATP-dependent helicase HrpB